MRAWERQSVGAWERARVGMLDCEASARTRSLSSSSSIRAKEGSSRTTTKTRTRTMFLFLLWFLSSGVAFGNTTNTVSLPTPLPDVGFSALRVFGSLVLVLSLFLGGVWIFRNWQRVAVYKGRQPQLSILEVKSLGNRHALYLVAYQQQRLLIASSPAGINLLTQLPEADAATPIAPLPDFAQSLHQALASKS